MADYQSSHSGSTIDTRVSQVSTNTADIAALKSRMNAAESEIDTKADATSVTALSSQVGGVVAKIPSEATTSNKLADKAYVNSSVSGKASQSDLTNLTNRVTAVEANKVDKVSGKGLSTNDYTTAEKNKVASIGNLNDLETEDKSSIVAAINEAATTGSGGGASLEGYVVVDSIANLPDPGQPTLGYLVGTHLYLYVGTGGDTKGGKYQDAGEFRGPQGPQGIQGIQGNTGPEGPQGPQGNTGSSVDFPFELANNLSTNDPEQGLAASQGPVIANNLPASVNEDGFFLCNDNLEIAARYDADGFDVAQVNPHLARELGDADHLNDSVLVKLSDFNNSQKTDDEIIADCLSFCSLFEKKTIVFDRDVYISNAILLESGTTVILDNVTVKQNNYAFDNAFRGANVVLDPNDLYYLPPQIDILEDIKIIGRGDARIIGCDVNATIEHPTLGEQEAVGDYYGVRTHMLDFSRIHGFEMSGVTISKTRGWCCHFDMCEDVYVHDIAIVTGRVKNGDGIDFHAGCKRCRVDNYYADTFDDAIACAGALKGTSATPYPRGNYMLPDDATYYLRPQYLQEDPEALYVDTIQIRNVTYHPTFGAGNGHGMICLSSYATKVQNIFVDNFVELADSVSKEALNKVFSSYEPGYVNGDLRKMRFNNIRSEVQDVIYKCTTVVSDIWLNKLVGENPYSITDMTGHTITNTVTNS